jgi:ferritin-like protein
MFHTRRGSLKRAPGYRPLCRQDLGSSIEPRELHRSRQATQERLPPKAVLARRDAPRLSSPPHLLKGGSVASETLHEERASLNAKTQDSHRAMQSLKEELDAIDWYQQRIDATTDASLKSVLSHNRDEEKEHASMLVEWIRRHDPKMAVTLRTYLFTERELTEIEEQAEQQQPEAP